MSIINVTIFPHFKCCKFWKIDGNANLSKYNIEAGERANLISEELKAHHGWATKKIFHFLHT